MVLSGWDGSTNGLPAVLPAASRHTGAAKPCTSTRWLQAPAAATGLLPKPMGTVAENDPSAGATVRTTDDGAPVVASSDSIATDACDAVVPVTAVDVAASVLPLTGAVTVTGSVPGGPCRT